jgi:hypothetical protein
MEREGIELKVAAFFLGLEVSPASAKCGTDGRGEDREGMYYSYTSVAGASR